MYEVKDKKGTVVWRGTNRFQYAEELKKQAEKEAEQKKEDKK